MEYGKAEWIIEEKEVCLLALGSMVKTAMEVHDRLREVGCGCSVINLRFASPIDYEAIKKASETHSLLVIMEENVASGGIGEHIQAWLENNNINTRSISISLPDTYIEHGSIDCLKKHVGIDTESVFERIFSTLRTEEDDETAN